MAVTLSEYWEEGEDGPYQVREGNGIVGEEVDSFRDVENAVSGSGGDTFAETGADNAFTGGGGNDLLIGGDGNDSLDGGGQRRLPPGRRWQ